MCQIFDWLINSCVASFCYSGSVITRLLLNCFTTSFTVAIKIHWVTIVVRLYVLCPIVFLLSHYCFPTRHTEKTKSCVINRVMISYKMVLGDVTSCRKCAFIYCTTSINPYFTSSINTHVSSTQEYCVSSQSV